MNLLDLPDALPGSEVAEALLPDRGVLIERIVSAGHASPPGFWYQQARDEWVAVLRGSARLRWGDGRERRIQAGEWLCIPAGERHRVEETSKDCIWLAVHGPLL